MKALLSTIVLWTGIFISMLQGQDLNQRLDLYDQKLNVYYQNRIVAIVSGQNIHDIKEDNRWRKLLTSFTGNLKSVKDEIPEYLIYKIEYEKDYNLIVEDVEGIVRYKVNNGQTKFDSYQSVAILRDSDFSIQLNFGELDDLMSIDYEKMIESAMSKLGKKPGQIRRVYFPKYKYDYSFSKKEMIKNPQKIEKKLVIPLHATIGLFKGLPIYEGGYGIGISFRKEEKGRYNLIYAYYSFVFQYDRELDNSEFVGLYGLAWKTKRAGTFGIGIPSEKKGFYKDIDFRLSSTLQTRNNLALSFHYYIGEKYFIPALSVGFAF